MAKTKRFGGHILVLTYLTGSRTTLWLSYNPSDYPRRYLIAVAMVSMLMRDGENFSLGGDFVRR